MEVFFPQYFVINHEPKPLRGLLRKLKKKKKQKIVDIHAIYNALIYIYI